MERARYKAEAGLSKRGFVQDRRSGSGNEGVPEQEEKEVLVRGERRWWDKEEGGSGERWVHDPPSVDGASSDGDVDGDGNGRGGYGKGGVEGVSSPWGHAGVRGRWVDRDRDRDREEEGWKPL